MVSKCNLIVLILLFIFLNSISLIYAIGTPEPEGCDNCGDNSGSDPNSNPTNPTNPSQPIDYCAQKGVHCIDKVNERPSGEFVLLDSVSSMYSDKFHFPGVKDITFNAYGGFLTSAAVTSSSDNNILWINNPLESAEKINIYLKNSHAFIHFLQQRNINFNSSWFMD